MPSRFEAHGSSYNNNSHFINLEHDYLNTEKEIKIYFFYKVLSMKLVPAIAISNDKTSLRMFAGGVT